MVFPLDMHDCVILTPTNQSSLEIKDTILKRMHGQLFSCFSVDSAVVDDAIDEDLYPVDFLHSLTPSGLPPHLFLLKVECVVMLLKNLLDLKAGLTKGSRLIVKHIYKNMLDVEILSGSHRGKRHFIPKMLFQPLDSILPFLLKRVQFPVCLSYSNHDQQSTRTNL